MRWRGGRRSSNVEDRRRRGFGGGGLRFPLSSRTPVRAGGIGGIGLLVLVGLYLFLNGDLGDLLQETPAGRQEQSVPGQARGPASAGDDELADFVSVVLADTEDTWRVLFRRAGDRYSEPTLVLFSGAVRSACGIAQSATGPFYCPADRKVYIDLSFYDDLKSRFQAPGDFAQAYVIAHEVGHHVQTLLGVSEKVRAAQARASRGEANAIQVRMELQADCLAGIWAHHADRARNILEGGDIEEALRAASAIGDDRLQKQSQGYVVPDAFTHGTSEQR
ncbi:MAG TPA: neutral zinc metallopeptidase, partial [Afifellaceae bacterium]|nr:neutral zinc metallopeptidase [Afifellaceae bacterium]